MKDFNQYLNTTGEVGYVDAIVHDVAWVSGLPEVRLGELVLFESDGMGQVLGLSESQVEVLFLTQAKPKIGTKVARTGEFPQIVCGEHLLGKILSPLGVAGKGEARMLDQAPVPILNRGMINEPLSTGVVLVDLVVPLAKGQRELVAGDRKTGKTAFLLQTAYTQALKGTICVYAAIGKKKAETNQIRKYFEDKKILSNVVMIATAASDPPGMVILTPYAAMTVAEYFKDQGKDVLVILDDMTTHAKYYRQVSLLARRFPGKNSYPGDIFYVHSKIMERAGKFKKGSITALPVAELVMGDLSGFIQTNLMSMTDGHIFFDTDFFNQGRRPAINPFLSVTRVGAQAQKPLFRSIDRELGSFLLRFEKSRQFLHFGAELSEAVRQELALGERILVFFDQPSNSSVDPNLSAYILAQLWTGLGKDKGTPELKRDIQGLMDRYSRDSAFRQSVDATIASVVEFGELIAKVRKLGWTQKA